MMPSKLLFNGVLCVLLVATLAACGKDEPSSGAGSQGDSTSGSTERSSGSRRERSGSAPKVAPEDRKDIDPAQTGAVRGVALYTEEAPKRKVIPTESAGGCGDHEVLTERVIVNDGKLQNVFVSVKRGLEAWNIPAAPSEPAVLDQLGCTYRPHVSGIQLGQTILVRNSDQATHNVHPHPRKNDAFNRSQAPNSADIEWKLDKAEVPFQVSCDIHPWMKAYVGVVEHPFFAVTDEGGAFEIAGLPAGEYVLEAWHEDSKKRKSYDVTVVAGETAELEMQFP